jgi:hypothetical protein
MVGALEYDREARGEEHLLADCAALQRLEETRLPVRRRLVAEVGDRLADLLVFALARGQRPGARSFR